MIFIIRHGQTELNQKHVLQGRSDMPMNETGIAQAEEAGRWLAEQGIVIDRIWSSPLERAIQTARIAAGEEVPLQTDERLLEMDYGPYEGASLESPPQEIIEFFSDFVNNPAPEGMESLDHIVKRLASFLQDLREEISEGEEERNYLISTHAIAMKGALEHLSPDAAGMYWSKHIANCEIYVTDLTEDGYLVPKPAKQDPAE